MTQESVDQEAETVMKVQYLCEVGQIHARALMELIHNESNDVEAIEYERSPYAAVRDNALQITEMIMDDFYQGSALHRVIGLCMECGERERAQSLLNLVSIEFIREQVLKEFPSLKGAETF